MFDNQNFIGEAVDEAAEWFEAADWIGVHMTPTAAFTLSDPGYWVEYAPPFKKGPIWNTPCVDWAYGLYPDEPIPERRRKLQDAFKNLGPIGPDIVGKFTNTLKFFDWITSNAQTLEKDKTAEK
ncbi:MAG: hypothetical protein NTY09_05810 [bacterium]|nr:hypothetical protein [bacterium]